MARLRGYPRGRYRCFSWFNIAFVNSYTTGKHNKQFNPKGTSISGLIRLNNAQEEKYKITLTPATGDINVAAGC